MLGSWAGCLRDEAEESERKGYRQDDVGVWSRFSIRGEKERIFYVPSAECSQAGENFVKIILEIIISEEEEAERNNKFLSNYQLYCSDGQLETTTVMTTVSSSSKSITWQAFVQWLWTFVFSDAAESVN